MFEFVATICAVYVLLAIAFPHVFLPPKKDKTRLVGSSYWGVYNDSPLHDCEVAGKVKAPKPARKAHPIAGSSMYQGKR